ncbi:tRNA uracil 4-sulfurtransferase ThiI [Pediococcus pentosaceus]|jgi:thiamine biosynthesis protein ThiI|uniref:tRNA uracil 4-sulfurtransferase ThiI n=1 Tax=Pediococcus pentosaceus TaxID=1255 RepID=UPI0019197129|nr:tRNA uracil 4-sulfurtransferase ThiI [Pediococcus pentosaceus]MCH4016513.1 tRNA 4-thiouridine(8) synthase ThiI [Pediococcus pentosaceus]MCI1285753.1 tRNA 4-thiouridine(8) synthase ThiI [Pediococcus pentosaceus]MCQ0028274.1 tRNA 4-thiouridine(8) synthase ThiI [Pediococcus pentosaceus]MCT3025991.1 tRNA 4-thiouridine(8) synthase ThiI [Pediococcus pentosaceus]MDD1389248.1 tRNA 4-thiouridine(8) synthase ThiI [Pediococcus pentosaceus]
MKYTEIMVRYGELSTKGKNRKDFIARLGGNIRKSLKDFEDVEIHPNRDRTHVTLNGTDSDAVINRLKKVFGIQNFSPMLKVEKTMEAVQAGALEMMKEKLKPGMTFKINTRRSDKEFAINTDTMNRELGGFILDNFPDNDVKMKNPDITLRVEIRSNGIFLTSEVINGAGGLPVGTAGKGMMMLSGGIDSPVAGYLGMKRGVEMEMVHFFSPPYTSEQALAKAKELSGKLAAYSGSVQFIQVPFTEIQETIKEKCPEGYLMTIQRRMMLRLVVALAKQRGGLAIFNGESLGQVASQTMESMLAINDVTTMPIIRPVVSMDKNEIIDIAKDIDTYDLSIMPFEDCCTIFAPPSPKTHPDLEKTRYFEKRIDVEGLLERSLAGVKITNIRAEENFMNQNEEVFAELL